MRLIRLGWFIGLCGLSTWAGAQDVPSFIQNMTGCFSVRYNFVENGDRDQFFTPTLEKAVFSQTNDVLHLRRFLILEGKEQVHWREEWRLQDESRNIWEQTVYGPGGDLRYRCSGAAVDNSWRCEALGASKPRRDENQPYAKLDRENTLKTNPKRWVHMQHNNKRMQDGSLFAVELGWNQYDRVDDASCQTQALRP